jgi:hypothetical protein
MHCNDMQRTSTQNMRGPYPRYARRIGLDTPDMREFVPLICVEKWLRSQPGEEVGGIRISCSGGYPLVPHLPY